jgi:predicted metal-dependent HD superfamily phosphohydrolase
VSSDELELRVAWQRHVAPHADAELESLIGRHRDVGRRYHDVRHVRWVVHHVRELADEHGLPDATTAEIVAAAFFHDAVYDPTRTDNEAASGRLATRVLTELGWAQAAVARVAAMIEATAGHADPGDDVATAVLLAADLGVLAAEPARYAEYTRTVRDEYAHLDDAAWRSGRSAFVTATLARSAIFPTVLALDGWERRARANLTAELATLE